jgi:hypothetical protein
MMVVVMVVIRHEGDKANKHGDEEDRDIRGDVENIAQMRVMVMMMMMVVEVTMTPSHSRSCSWCTILGCITRSLVSQDKGAEA